MNLTELRIQMSRIQHGTIKHYRQETFARFASSEISDPKYHLSNIGEDLEKLVSRSGIWAEVEVMPEFQLELGDIKDKQLKIKDQAEFILTELQRSLSQDEKDRVSEAFKELLVLVKEDDKDFIDRLNARISEKERRSILKKVGSLGTELLFHGTKLEYAKATLERESILGYTTQRYWEGGKRYTESDSQYKESFWMHGISMTRDIDFAVGWASVVFAFDRKEIMSRHKVDSYNWSFHIDDHKDHKKEREDFVILKKTGKTFLYKDDPEFMTEYNDAMALTPNRENSEEDILYYQKKLTERMDMVNIQKLQEPEGEFEFGTSLKGVIIKGSAIDIFGIDHESIQFVINHPLFMGILED